MPLCDCPELPIKFVDSSDISCRLGENHCQLLPAHLRKIVFGMPRKGQILINKHNAEPLNVKIRNKPNDKPVLAFVGPIFDGSQHSAPTQAFILAGLFEQEGYRVFRFSTFFNRIRILLDIAISLVRYQGQIDIALIQVYSGRSFIMADVGSWFCQRLNIRMVLVLHGGNLPQMMTKQTAWTLRVMRRANLIVAPSPFLQETMRQHNLRCDVVYNVLELDQYPFTQRKTLRPVILWMRSFGALYNPFLAIRVLVQLRERYPTARLLMAGPDHGLLAKTQSYAAELGVNKVIEWFGYIDHTKKLEVARQADIYINTNQVDNMPVSLLEMAAMGLPIVSTRVGGIP